MSASITATQKIVLAALAKLLETQPKPGEMKLNRFGASNVELNNDAFEITLAVQANEQSATPSSASVSEVDFIVAFKHADPMICSLDDMKVIFIAGGIAYTMTLKRDGYRLLGFLSELPTATALQGWFGLLWPEGVK